MHAVSSPCDTASLLLHSVSCCTLPWLFMKFISIMKQMTSVNMNGIITRNIFNGSFFSSMRSLASLFSIFASISDGLMLYLKKLSMSCSRKVSPSYLSIRSSPRSSL